MLEQTTTPQAQSQTGEDNPNGEGEQTGEDVPNDQMMQGDPNGQMMQGDPNGQMMQGDPNGQMMQGDQVGGGGLGFESFVDEITYCDGTAEGAKNEALRLISEYTSTLRVLYATNERSTVGVCEAVEQAINEGTINEGDISVIGFNSNSTEQAYIRSGLLSGTMLQSPYNMGYLGVYYAGQVLSGASVPDSIDTGAVYLDIDNIDSESMKLMLNPLSLDTAKQEGN